MYTIDVHRENGHVQAFVADAEEFADENSNSREMSKFSGKVAWLEWVAASRLGGGVVLVEWLLSDLRDDGVNTIGLQVVPPDQEGDSRAVKKLVAYYRRFGFEVDPSMAPWRDYPVMTMRLM